MRHHKILIIEDEVDVVDLLTLHLAKAGTFTTMSATDGTTGLKKAREETPALVVLDLMLPSMSGLDVCKILKTDAATQHIPVLMLTAKAEEIDRIVGLEIGADDYVTKPFSPREVVLRINAILRRGQNEKQDETLTIGTVKLDSVRHNVFVAGKRLRLTAVEFRLLNALMHSRGRVHSRDRLLNEVWGYETAIDTRTVDTHVRRLREKMGKAGAMIETVRGFGYRLREG